MHSTRLKVHRIPGLASVLLGCLLLSGCPKAPPPPPVLPSPAPSATPAPQPTPEPIPNIPRKPLVTAKLFNGLTLQAKVLTETSEELASRERRNLDAYQVEITIRARLPRPSLAPADFLKNDPHLAGTFQDFDQVLAGAKVSPFFEKLYRQ